MCGCGARFCVVLICIVLTCIVAGVVVFGGSGIVGNFFDHAIGIEVEADAADIFDRDVKGAEDEFGAVEIDGVAGEGVDDLHERGLEGFFVFDESDGMEAGLRRGPDATDHALMEIAELLSAKCGRTATDSGDLDVRACFDVGMDWHINTCNFLIVVSQNPGFIGVRRRRYDGVCV